MANIACEHYYEYGAKDQPPAIFDIAVTADGTVFTNEFYDEGHMTLGMFRNGQIVGWPDCNKSDDPFGGGWAATTNGTYVFIAWVDPNHGKNGISRFNIDGTKANVVGGTGYYAVSGNSADPAVLPPNCTNSVLVDAHTGGFGFTSNTVWGMASSSTGCSSNRGCLFVSDSYVNRIEFLILER